MITFILHVRLYPRLHDTRTEIMMMISVRIMAKGFVQFTDIAVEILQKTPICFFRSYDHFLIHFSCCIT